MSRWDYTRRPTRDTQWWDLPKATPISRAARKAQATLRRQRQQQHLMANQDPEKRHAQHPAQVQRHGQQLRLWCLRCDCEIVTLTDQEAAIWRELNPPRVQKSRK